MQKKIKNILKKQTYLLTLFGTLAKWQYSSNARLRLIGKALTLPLFFILKERYYRILLLIRNNKHTTKENVSSYSNTFSRFLPEQILMRIIEGDTSVTAEEYEHFLIKRHFPAKKQFDWSNQLIGLGRLDLAKIGFIQIANRPSHQTPRELRLECFRFIGATSFILGSNTDFNKYLRIATLFKRALFQPTTPKTYRILGSGWFGALGHICNLDYYLKFIKLNTENNLRVVIPFNPDQAIGEVAQYILNKYAALGIHSIHPNDIEKDYNTWAKDNNYLLWNQLLSCEKAALVDDCWDFDFNDGETLPFVHAHARIQKDWEQAGHPPLFSLSHSEKKWISDYLSMLGIPPNAWYVCLHVRESGYHKSWDTLYSSIRDANISDYNLAIETIVNAGGWVIRMGDSSMSPMPPMRNVIDYANYPLKTPAADVLLLAGCRFLLCTNSGYVNICSMYHVPCVLTNWIPIGTPLAMKHDLLMPKLLRNKETGNYLTIEDMFKSEIGYIMNRAYLPNNIEPIPNTPEELAQITLEMMSQCRIETGLPTLSPGVPNSIQSYYNHIAETYGGYTGSTLSRTFFEKHKEILFETQSLIPKVKSYEQKDLDPRETEGCN
jgi:putative glycosyltransferase (TIGR04372 family)